MMLSSELPTRNLLRRQGALAKTVQVVVMLWSMSMSRRIDSPELISLAIACQ